MKNRIRNSATFISAGLCLLICLLANHARAAVVTWDPQGSNTQNFYTGSLSGTWESANWDTANETGTATLANWPTSAGNAALFAVHSGTGTPAFTVTMNANHTVAGIFNGSLTPNPCPVTIAGAGTFILGPGNLNGMDPTSDGGDPGSIVFDVVVAGDTTAGMCAENGAGQVYLNETNTYAGGTYLGYNASTYLNGIWNFNNYGSFGTGPIVILNSSGGALVAQGSSAFTIPNAVTVYNKYSSTLYFVGPVPIAANLNIVGIPAGVTFSGPWALSGGSGWTGANIYANTSLWGNYTVLSLGSGGAANDVVNISGVMSGSCNLTKYGVGVLELSGANTMSGPVTISAGTVQLGNPAGLGCLGAPSTNGTVIVSSGATLDLNGQTGINASINLYGSGNNSGNGSLVNSNATTTAVLNGPSGVESAIVTTAFTSTAIPGTAAFTVTGGNGTGATAVPSLGLTPASFTVTSGTTTYKIPPTVTLSGGGGSGAIVTAVTNSSGNTVSTTLVITAPGFGYTTAPTVSFSGGTVLVAGTNPTISANANNFQLMGVQITAPGSGYTTPPVWTISGFTGSAIAVLNSLNLATSTAIGGPGNIVIGSPISGAGTLTNIGPGTVTLSAANTYTGGTLIKAGTLKLGDGVSNNGSVAGNITNNAALILANPLAQTYAGVISGTGTVTETGPGVMTLTGASTYTGATTVSAGTLSVGTGGSLAAGTSATVTTGGTLGVADGTINGSVAVNAGGTLLATGAASAINGATTVSGALSMVDGAIDTVTFGSSLALSGTTSMEVIEGSGFNLEDEIVMTSGTVTLGGTLTVTQIDANAFMLNDTFQLFSGTIAGSFTGINLPVLPAGLAWDKSGLKPGGSGYITVVSAPSAPQATAIASLPDGNFSLTVTGAVGQPFALYGTNNVAAPTPWTLLTNGTIPASSFTVYDLMATNYPQRFYYLTNTP